jgi:hypothetical protein
MLQLVVILPDHVYLSFEGLRKILTFIHYGIKNNTHVVFITE